MMTPLAVELARHGIAAIAFDFGRYGECASCLFVCFAVGIADAGAIFIFALGSYCDYGQIILVSTFTVLVICYRIKINFSEIYSGFYVAEFILNFPGNKE